MRATLFSQFGSVVQEILSISSGTDIKNHPVLYSRIHSKDKAAIQW